MGTLMTNNVLKEIGEASISFVGLLADFIKAPKFKYECWIGDQVEESEAWPLVKAKLTEAGIAIRPSKWLPPHQVMLCDTGHFERVINDLALNSNIALPEMPDRPNDFLSRAAYRMQWGKYGV